MGIMVEKRKRRIMLRKIRIMRIMLTNYLAMGQIKIILFTQTKITLQRIMQLLIKRTTMEMQIILKNLLLLVVIMASMVTPIQLTTVVLIMLWLHLVQHPISVLLLTIILHLNIPLRYTLNLSNLNNLNHPQISTKKVNSDVSTLKT